MGFLKKFFNNVLRESPQPPTRSSFESLSEQELETHLGVTRYGEFELTDAIRPSYDLKVIPREGYRHERYHDKETNSEVPVIMCAASRQKLFDIFVDLLEPLGNVVDVVLETSHDGGRQGHNDLYREYIDMPVLKSVLWDYEDLLTNDGCTGIAILNPRVPQEIQFDEHKLLIVYGEQLEPFEEILSAHRVSRQGEMKFITEAEHVHSSCDTYLRQFDELKTSLGMDAEYYPSPI